MKDETRDLQLTVGQIETIVQDCRCFDHLESRSALDKKHWASTSAQVDQQYVRNNAKRIHEVIKLLAPWAGGFRSPAPGACPTLLEVGIGYGELALSASRAFPWLKVTGLEHPGRAFLNDEHYRSKMNGAGIDLVAADISSGRLPFDDATFEIVLFCEVLEHMSPVEVPRIIGELARILKDGGALVIASPNLTSLFNRAVFASGASVLTPAISLDYAGKTFGHIRLYTVAELAGLASLAGLRAERVQYNDTMLMSGTETRWRTIVVKRVQTVLTKVFPALSANWTVVFSK